MTEQIKRVYVYSPIMDRYKCVEGGVEIANRRKFEEEHKVFKKLRDGNRYDDFLRDPTKGRLYMTLHLDHEEWYETRDGFIIWISTPYRQEDDTYLQNTIFGEPWQKTDCLYNAGHSYYKKFRKNIRFNAEEYAKWNWKGKTPEPKCGCGNTLYLPTYNIKTNTWKSELTPKHILSRAKRIVEHDICRHCYLNNLDNMPRSGKKKD